MRVPGGASLVFLLYLLVLLPWAALRSARRLAAARAGVATLPPREAIWTGTLFVQLLLFVLAWVTAWSFDYRIFAVPSVGLREVAAGAAALAIYLGLRSLSRGLRTEQERRKMTVYAIAPRSGDAYCSRRRVAGDREKPHLAVWSVLDVVYQHRELESFGRPPCSSGRTRAIGSVTHIACGASRVPRGLWRDVLVPAEKVRALAEHHRMAGECAQPLDRRAWQREQAEVHRDDDLRHDVQ